MVIQAGGIDSNLETVADQATQAGAPESPPLEGASPPFFLLSIGLGPVCSPPPNARTMTLSTITVSRSSLAEAAAKLDRYLSGRTRDAFGRESMVVDTVVPELEILGGVAGK